jgi:Zn-dependent metalloprotease
MFSKKLVLVVAGVLVGAFVFYAYTNSHEDKIDWASLPEAAEVQRSHGKFVMEANSTLQSQKPASKGLSGITSLTKVSEKAKILGLRVKSSIDSAEGKKGFVNKSYQELQARLADLDDNAVADSPSELITDSQRYVKHVLFHYQETSMRIDSFSDAMSFLKKLSVSSSNSVSPVLVNDQKVCSGEVCSYRYETTFNGHPIFGDSIVLTTVRDRPSKLSGFFLQPDLREQQKEKIDISAPLLFDKALAATNSLFKPDDFSIVEGYVRDERYLYPSYLITLKNGSSAVAEVIIDSYSGEIVSEESLVHEGIPASGTDLFGATQSFNVRASGGKYILEDDTIPAGFSTKIADAGLITQNEYETAYLSQNLLPPLVTSDSLEGGWSPEAVNVVSSLYNLSDYFDREHEYRIGDGYNQGYEIVIDINMDNAFAIGALMGFGRVEGFNSARAVDVVGHELTHSIINATSKLVYRRESGALNESFADFFGEIAEGKLDWRLGEDIYTERDDYLRSLSNPNLKNQPAHMRDFRFMADDNGGVHFNSGIPNRFLYLLAQGLAREGLGDALGVKTTATLAFQTLLGLTPYASFGDFYASFSHLATNLYGDSSGELDSIRLAARQVGFVADSVLSTPVGSSLTPADLNALTSLRYNESSEGYDVYLQLFANQLRSYFEEDEFQVGLGAALSQPVTLLYENLDYVTFYKKTNGDIFEQSRINGENYAGVIFSADDLDGLEVNSLIVSADKKYLAIVFSGRGSVFLYNLQTSELRNIEVTSPSYTEDFEGIAASRVDSIRFDPSGRTLALDFEICTGASQDSCYWSIAFIDAEAGAIEYPFKGQPSKYTVGYPAFGNIDTTKIAIDIIDTEENRAGVYIYDILTGDIRGISGVRFEGVEGLYFGNPSFTADDSAIVFTVSQSETEQYVYTIPVTDYDRSGDAEPLNPRPVFLARSESIVTGTQIPELSVSKNVLEFATFSAQSEDLCLINSDRFDVEIKSVNLPNNFYSPEIPSKVNNESQSCFRVIFESGGLSPQTVETVMTINHDGANSPTLISLRAEVTIDPSVDSDGDGVNDIDDDDRDGDGYLNVGDLFPDDPREWYDSDADEIGDNSDVTYNPESEREFLLTNRMDACDSPFDDDVVQWEIDGVLSSAVAAGGAMRTKLAVGRHVFRIYRDSKLVETYIGDIYSNTNYLGWGCKWDETSYQDILDTYVISEDSDGDLISGSDDAFPDDRTESVDTDRDGIGNNSDTDDDGDGYSDQDELEMGSDPLNSSDVPRSGGLSPALLRVISQEVIKQDEGG